MSDKEATALQKIAARLPPPEAHDIRRDRNRFILQYLVTYCTRRPTWKEKFRKLIEDLKIYRGGDWVRDQHLVAPRNADARHRVMFEIMKRGAIMSVSRLYDIVDEESDVSDSI